jgi:membrane protease YdiL (CAAX protease family)
MTWPEEHGDWVPYPDEGVVERSSPLGFIRVLLSWMVIVGAVAFIVYRVNFTDSTPPADMDAADAKKLVLVRIQGMYLVGAHNLTGRKDKQYSEIAASLDVGPPPQRLCSVILTGELANAGKAREALKELETQWQDDKTLLTDKQLRAVQILERAYDDYAHKRFEAPSVNESDREALIDELGWFGRLALAPPETNQTIERDAVLAPANRTVVILVGVLLVFGLLFFVGFIGLLALPIFAYLGYLKGGLDDGVPNAGIYAETFALWLLFFLGMGWMAGLVAHRIDFGEWHMLASGVGMLLSLVVLVWPVVRGIPWKEVKSDIGWEPGRAKAAEPVFGLATFTMSVPLLLVGLILTLILVGVSQSIHPTDPNERNSGHPIFELLQHANWWQIVQAFFAASVVAPIVEETMFRGVLYRHLRSAFGGGGFILSFLASTVLVSFIFAVIHPQGWIATPALMCIAFALTIAREWRVSLIPGMVHHGIHNGLILTFALLILN